MWTEGQTTGPLAAQNDDLSTTVVAATEHEPALDANGTKAESTDQQQRKRGRGGSKKVRRENYNKRQKNENHMPVRQPLRERDEDEEAEAKERRPKRKVACMIGYCGTGYHGMQINPPQKTIEGDIFNAFVKAGAISQDNSNDPKKSAFMRAARTDKGVHAAGNVISLKLIVEDADVVEKINTFLPGQIRLWGYSRTTKGFECRKHCDSRIYEYLIPSYSFLPPKPGSALAKRIQEMADEFPGVTREDPEGAKFWADVAQQVKDAGIDEDDIRAAYAEALEEQALNKKMPHDDGSLKTFLNLSDEQYNQLKQIRAIENAARRAFRISTERQDLIRQALKRYEGPHNFHNFTIGKDFNDPSSRRYMKSLVASDAKIIEGSEWISIKIHGQSFMLHQIRKMIGMVAQVVRCGAPLDRINEAFHRRKINIPKAPALGLLLERPVYANFNERLKSFGRDAVSFDAYNDQMEEFKMKYIYDKIYAEEAKENIFYGFFGFIDNFKGDVHLFDYLTAKGIAEGDAAAPFTDGALKEMDEEDMEELEGDNEG
ncbi:pseudouridine synthase [Lipomyces tetrasporus]|uniref:tRNA pseudouridine synthase 1 n=1 Tax=Lipomyces tetrasporus TaxID=54092 RepID=A0AAD7QR13_9ASCO|nr:pseudouridine synthase [Lipomyces tetrasporus]KAJ8099854.1 pseudouridine synthase [Lipomyces tetrasporus]